MNRPTGLWPQEEARFLPGEGPHPTTPVAETKGSAKDFISLVVPFYNEGEGVRYFHEAIVPIMEQIPGIVFEVVCVDDGSRDRTLEFLL